MLDVFEAMTTEERRVLYTVCLACVAVGIGAGLWFYSEWNQLKRLFSHLLVIAAVGVAVWYFAVEDPGGARLPQLFNTASSTQTAPRTTTPPLPKPNVTSPQPAPSGAWWE